MTTLKYKHPLHNIYDTMVGRCHNPNNNRFEWYGARGITVCDEWRADFWAFVRDMDPRPGLEYSLDRRDNDAGYSKDNCRWILHTEQHRNRRNNHWIEIGDHRMILLDWANLFGYDESLVRRRLRNGWSPEAALYWPPNALNPRRKPTVIEPHVLDILSHYKDDASEAEHRLKVTEKALGEANAVIERVRTTVGGVA